MAKATWPTRWLMTDERMGDELLAVLARLPAGAGVVFRHHALAPAERAALGDAVAREAHSRGLVLAVSRDTALAATLDAALIHNPDAPSDRPFSRSVHSWDEAKAAAGCALAFVSPVAPTRSHPRRRALTSNEIADILAALDAPAIALGGMDEARFARVRDLGFHGWAGIDAWRQNLRAVPT